jgi:formylglycine-generating enzyme required for sulfatase activity
MDVVGKSCTLLSLCFTSNSISVQPKMIPLMPGTFQMDNPTTNIARFSNEQQHAVQLTTAFALSETEVTQRQYAQLLNGVNPSQYQGDPERPVESVSWFEAVAYCNLLSIREGLPPCYQISGQNVAWEPSLKCGYRLPTEAEWEYAARANSGKYQQYAGSDAVGDVAWYATNAVMPEGPRPVRTKAPNSWGLYDLSGNVWEWVWDWYGDYPMIPLAMNPIQAQSGSERVVRGGSWLSIAGFARVASRFRDAPSLRDNVVGFRLARSYP